MSLDSKILFFIALSLFVHCIECKIINQNVERNLDLSTQLVKDSVKITAADDSGQTIKEYVVLIPDEMNNLAHASAKDGMKKEIPIKQTIKDGKIQLTLTMPQPAVTQSINLELVFSHRLQPHPFEIKQSDKQLIKYSGSLYFFSPYKTKTQKLSVKLSTSNIISHTQIKPFTVSSNKIKYGAFENIEELSNQTLFIHYENQTPFMTVRHLERCIEVSHWGNIAIKEDIHIEHTGAKLKGSFSRYEFQKDGRSGQSAVKAYKTILPASATDVYYRDMNGNISTSNMRIMRDSVELELRPRFPLFGGWRTQYVLGYNVPSFEYLYNSNKNFMLKIRVLDHVFDDMVVDEAVIKVILPEGCANIQLITPYTVKRHSNELHYTYLDTVGRPVIVFSKTNLVENHIADFQIKYKFAKMSLLQEPLLVIAFIFVIFIIAIVSIRLDFSITSGSHNHKD